MVTQINRVLSQLKKTFLKLSFIGWAIFLLNFQTSSQENVSVAAPSLFKSFLSGIRDPLTHILTLKHLFKKIYSVLTKIDKFEKDLYFKYRTTVFLAKSVNKRMPSLLRKSF